MQQVDEEKAYKRKTKEVEAQPIFLPMMMIISSSLNIYWLLGDMLHHDGLETPVSTRAKQMSKLVELAGDTSFVEVRETVGRGTALMPRREHAQFKEEGPCSAIMK